MFEIAYPPYFPGTWADLQDLIYQPPAPCILLKDFRARRSLWGRRDEGNWSVIEAVTLTVGNCAASVIASCFGVATVSPTDTRRSALVCRIDQPLLLLVIK